VEKLQEKSDSEERFRAFLLAMTKSQGKKKVCIHFGLKGTDKDFEAWLTYKQYLVFRKIECLEYCNAKNQI
jgi:hypothetical protein